MKLLHAIGPALPPEHSISAAIGLQTYGNYHWSINPDGRLAYVHERYFRGGAGDWALASQSDENIYLTEGVGHYSEQAREQALSRFHQWNPETMDTGW